MSFTRTQRLSGEQRHELETLLHTTRNVKVYRRIQVILSKEAGYVEDEIQEHTGYSKRAQWWWLSRYARQGIKGLLDKPRSGRPRQPQQPKPPPKPDESSSADSRLPYWARVTLEQMHAHHPKRYLRDRAQIVLLRNKGYAVRVIADILKVQVRTVRTVLANYNRDKLAGLYRKPGSGRRSALRPEQWEQVKDWVAKGPKALGDHFVKWTTRSLRKYLDKRFNRTFCREWIRQKLHQFMRYSWTRGKTVYASAHDPAWKTTRKAFCQQVLALLHRAAKGEIILLFEDETILSLFGKVGYSWTPVGTTQAVPFSGKRERVVVFGAVDPISGRTQYRQEHTINQDSTLRFLTQLLRYYQKHQPGTPVVFVFDKHKGHTATIIAELLVKHPHRSVLTTPPKSPDLNPQEHIWDWLDEQMIKNDFFEQTDEMKKAVRHFFSYLAGLKKRVIHYLGHLQTLYSTETGLQVGI